MAKLTLTDAYVSVGGSDESDHVKSLTIQCDCDCPDATAMSESWSNALAGVLSFSLDIEFYADFADDDISEDIWTAYAAKSTLAIIIKPTSDAVDADNPSFTSTCYVQSFPPLAGSHGDVVMMPVKFVNASSTGMARAVA